MLFQVASESLLLPFSGLWTTALGCACVRASIHPSVLPTGASLHPHPSVFIFPFLWAGSSHLALLKCMFGEILPVFLTREPAAGAGQGGCRVCFHLLCVPAPRSPPRPGVSPARHFGKGSPVVLVVLAVSISWSKICFHIYMSRGWAWWRPLNPRLFIL